MLRTPDALAADSITAASVLALVQGVERVGPDAPAAIASKGALRREGVEAVAPGALLLDQAGRDTTKKLTVPASITLLPLPPRSSELNPLDPPTSSG